MTGNETTGLLERTTGPTIDDRRTTDECNGPPATGQTLAGDGAGYATPPVADELEVEGAAPRVERPGVTQVVARLFRADHAPTVVDPADLPRIVAADENVVWIDLTAYGEGDLRALAGALALDPAAVRVALAAWQRPRLDVFADHFFVSATVARVDPSSHRVRAGQLDLFVGRNFLLSAHREPLPFGERVAARAEQSPDLVRLDSAFMLFLVLDELLEYYDGLTEGLEDEIEAMEERALSDTADPFLEELLRLKRRVFALGRLIDQHREVFVAFLRPDFRFVAGDEVLSYYRDLEARLERLLDRTTAAREAVNGAFDIYVSHVAHRTNHVMKLLTVVSTTVLPATVFLGIFSTSIEGLAIYRPLGFIAMLLGMLLLSGLILLMFRRRGWV